MWQFVATYRFWDQRCEGEDNNGTSEKQRREGHRDRERKGKDETKRNEEGRDTSDACQGTLLPLGMIRVRTSCLPCRPTSRMVN